MVVRTLKTRLKHVVNRPPSKTPAKAPSKRGVFSIGIYSGKSPFELVPLDNVANPVLTREHVSDVDAALVADPFMINTDRLWYMFFEALNRESNKGNIALAISDNGLEWDYQQIILTEHFHLSYPYVFEWQSEYYMVPECYETDSVRLYKAADFPRKWSFVGAILKGTDYVDPSIFRFDNRWWLFVGHGTAPERADILRLYYADGLMGPWLEHPESPIIEGDTRRARPAGRVLVFNDKVIRYAQDCYPVYGTQVRAFEITELSRTTYREREVVEKNPVLTASGIGWNSSGMHHIDGHLMHDGRWLSCVDGRGFNPRK